MFVVIRNSEKLTFFIAFIILGSLAQTILTAFLLLVGKKSFTYLDLFRDGSLTPLSISMFFSSSYTLKISKNFSKTICFLIYIVLLSITLILEVVFYGSQTAQSINTKTPVSLEDMSIHIEIFILFLILIYYWIIEFCLKEKGSERRLI
jgi:hypothetical protein